VKGEDDLRDSREHALIHREDQIRNLGAAHAGLGQDALEAEVLQIPNIRVGAARESKRVAPEEPLEAHDSHRHEREPDQRERGLSAREARVEEANAGNHEEHECGGCEHPCDVSGLWVVRLGSCASVKRAYLIVDVAVVGKGIAAGRTGAIVGNRIEGRHDSDSVCRSFGLGPRSKGRAPAAFI
jgi:hypothetical protein